MDQQRLGTMIAEQMENLESSAEEGSEIGAVASIVQIVHPTRPPELAVRTTCPFQYELVGLLQLAHAMVLRQRED
jgi:hypothetical protein